jgi:hypothetical protein
MGVGKEGRRGVLTAARWNSRKGGWMFLGGREVVSLKCLSAPSDPVA